MKILAIDHRKPALLKWMASPAILRVFLDGEELSIALKQVGGGCFLALLHSGCMIVLTHQVF